MFVAITGVTEFGQPLFCVNPAKTTVEIKNAFWWPTRQEAERVLKEAKEVYDLDAFPIEVKPISSKLQKVESSQTKLVG
jgi:hypothetical protein